MEKRNYPLPKHSGIPGFHTPVYVHVDMMYVVLNDLKDVPSKQLTFTMAL